MQEDDVNKGLVCVRCLPDIRSAHTFVQWSWTYRPCSVAKSSLGRPLRCRIEKQLLRCATWVRCISDQQLTFSPSRI